MSCLEFLMKVETETRLPVVMMSDAFNEHLVMHGLSIGALMFLLKPLCDNDINQMWQFPIVKQREVLLESRQPLIGSRQLPPVIPNNNPTILESSNGSQRNGKRKIDDMQRGHCWSVGQTSASNWAQDLRRGFLNIAQHSGVPNASPSAVAQFINVPGVASANSLQRIQMYFSTQHQLQTRMVPPFAASAIPPNPNFMMAHHMGQAPNNHHGQAPNGNYVQAPNGNYSNYVQAANGNYVQAPNGNYGQASNGNYGNYVQAPNGNYGNYVQAPNGNYGQAPNNNHGQVPNGNYVQAPNGNYGNYVQAANNNYVQASNGNYGNYVQAPNGNYGQAPNNNHGQALNGNYVQAPNHNYVQAPNNNHVTIHRTERESALTTFMRNPYSREQLKNIVRGSLSRWAVQYGTRSSDSLPPLASTTVFQGPTVVQMSVPIALANELERFIYAHLNATYAQPRGFMVPLPQRMGGNGELVPSFLGVLDPQAVLNAITELLNH
ncbi:uncharacterized protein LOC141594355 [Silene latifolia]|uniref:uncharacterized protein LOC141594355 n=1 Tax=Silene latifolia TaxID=37657 RepID=UPI003D778B52